MADSAGAMAQPARPDDAVPAFTGIDFASCRSLVRRKPSDAAGHVVSCCIRFGPTILASAPLAIQAANKEEDTPLSTYSGCS